MEHIYAYDSHSVMSIMVDSILSGEEELELVTELKRNVYYPMQKKYGENFESSCAFLGGRSKSVPK